MSRPFAAIDLGTNTFHLLIAVQNGPGHRELVRRVDPVKLGEGGITNGIIAPAPFRRGITMLKEYAALCKQHNVEKARAIGTSAIRNARNGGEFSDEVYRETGIRIITVDGEEEAKLIYQGVRASGCLAGSTSLIVDIGGGSVEFILCDEAKIAWKASFEIGAARLMERFHETDPIPGPSLSRLQQFLGGQLEPLLSAAAAFPAAHLVGAAGAFETFAEMMEPGFEAGAATTYVFDKEKLLALLSWLKNSSHAQRVATGKIIPLRIDMIVSAALITEFVIRTLSISKVSMTTYSLKEGVLAELIEAAS